MGHEHPALRRRDDRLRDQHPRVRSRGHAAEQPRVLGHGGRHDQQHDVPRGHLRPRAQRVHEHARGTPTVQQDGARASRPCRCSTPRRCSSTWSPRFNWDGRIGTTFSPTNQTEYAPFINANPTQDLSGSLTKTFGQHTAKAGIYFSHSVKPQSSRAAGQREHQLPERRVESVRHRVPVRQRRARHLPDRTPRRRQWVQGNYVYNNVEWYVQDNWKAGDHLTLDYGVRFYWMQQTHDTKNQTSNFLPDQYDASSAPRLYYPAIGQRRARRARPRHGPDHARGGDRPHRPGLGLAAERAVPGRGAGHRASISTRTPGSRYAPRVRPVLRSDRQADDHRARRRRGLLQPADGRHGLRHDRAAADGRRSPTLFYGRLQDINANSALVAPPTLFAFEQDGTFPRVYAYNVGRPAPVAVEVGARRVLRRDEEPQPAHAEEHQRARLRRRVPAAEPGSDAAGQHHSRRARRCRSTSSGPTRATGTSSSSTPAPTPTTTRCRCRSTGGSRAGCCSRSTTP